MQKVIVIGCPGSGKSTFSKKLHDITGLPLYRLDMTQCSIACLTTRLFEECRQKLTFM